MYERGQLRHKQMNDVRSETKWFVRLLVFGISIVFGAVCLVACVLIHFIGDFLGKAW